MPARSPRPEDLYDLRVPTDLELSPDGRFVWTATRGEDVLSVFAAAFAADQK